MCSGWFRQHGKHLPDGYRPRNAFRRFNIGNNQPMPLMDFISILEGALGRTAEKNYLPMQDGDVPATYADTDRLAEWVGFSPTMPVDTGIARFVDWYFSFFPESAIPGRRLTG